MSSPKLYAFFCAEECKKNEELILRIDNNFKTIYEVYSYFSINIYNKYKYINSIIPENKLFFGASPDGFSDCLTEFLDQNTNLLRIEIIDKSTEISENEIYVFLHGLLANILNHDYDSKLRVFVSKEILNIYLRESRRLLDLDTHPDDFVVY